MSIPAFSQVIVGFGNSRGETTTKLLSETAQKINRVNIKSQFGSNPRISIKPVPQVSLSPFQQMIYKKHQYAKLKQLIYGQSKLHQSDPKKYLQQIKQSALKSYQQLAQELELIKNFGQNEDLQFLITKTNCSEQQAKKYMQKYKNKDKAMEMIVRHRVMVDDVAKKFMCNKNEAKQFLEANDYSMDLLS